MLPVMCHRQQVQRCLESTGRVAAARLPYRVKVTAAKRYAWCACGHSKKQVNLSDLRAPRILYPPCCQTLALPVWEQREK